MLVVGGLRGGTGTRYTLGAGGVSAGESVHLLAGSVGEARVAVAAGRGGPARVTATDGATGVVVADFREFEDAFTGGLLAAAADLDGDGLAEVVVSPDQGGGPVVAVYSGAGLTAGRGATAPVARFFGIADPAFRGGARTALGDIDRDGTPDLVVAAGIPGGPRVAVYGGRGLLGGEPARLVADFFAFGPGLGNGAFVAVGDVGGDGHAGLAFGGGPGGGPRVRLVSGRGPLAAPRTPRRHGRRSLGELLRRRR